MKNAFKLTGFLFLIISNISYADLTSIPVNGFCGNPNRSLQVCELTSSNGNHYLLFQPFLKDAFTVSVSKSSNLSNSVSTVTYIGYRALKDEVTGNWIENSYKLTVVSDENDVTGKLEVNGKSNVTGYSKFMMYKVQE